MLATLAVLSVLAAPPGPPKVEPSRSGPATEQKPDARAPDRVTLRLPAPATVNPLPGGRAVVLWVDASPTELTQALGAIPAPLWSRATPTQGGARVLIAHPNKPLLTSVSRSGKTVDLQMETEEQRLRQLARRARRPIPEPPGLGPHLELWREAEAATSRGSLKAAHKLWTKVHAVRELRDLAAFRLAQLFLISGHVNEALARLRHVSRAHPRTPGAALARVVTLELEAMTGDAAVNPEQIVIAASAVSQQTYHAYTWLQAAHAFEALDRPDLALLNFPDIDALPVSFRAAAQTRRHELVSAALGLPFARGDERTTAIAHETWREAVAAHPSADALQTMVADAYLALGLHAQAAPLLRAHLARFPAPAEEARTVVNLADAYAMGPDRERHREAVSFLLAHHPAFPATAVAARAYFVRMFRESGLDPALSALGNALSLARNATLRRSLLITRADLLATSDRHALAAENLLLLEKVGFDDADRRGRDLALALARSGRARTAEPRLRRHVSMTADPEARDELAFALAQCELALGRTADAERILAAIAHHGTRWGLIARALQRERSLQRITSSMNDSTDPRAPASGATIPEAAP